MEKMMSLETRCRLLSHFFFPFFPLPPVGEVTTGAQPCVETANLTHVGTTDFEVHAMGKPEGEMVRMEKWTGWKTASKIFFNLLGQKYKAHK